MDATENTDAGVGLPALPPREGPGGRDDRGAFGAWAPGVLEGFLEEVLADRKSTAAGAIVGREEAGRPVIDGIIATVQRGPAGAVAFDRASWGWVHEARGSYYGDSAVIGWYCSRPGVGAVPTEVDVETHQRYFPDGDYVLICVDPVAATIAAFAASPGGQMVGLGSGDLHEMLGVTPLEPPRFRFAPELVAAGLCGATVGLLAWALAGGGGWPFA